MSTSDSSALSSPPSTDDEMPSIPSKSKGADDSFLSFDGASPGPPAHSPERKKRPASPPHEEVLADNPDIAFIVMFRSRFSDAFPPKLIQFGPQDIERGVVDPLPSPQVEGLLCALLGLVLNRKKYVERGHYGRALEEAIQTQKHQWPRAWNGVNPLHGPRNFNIMTPQERLTLLKTLILWSLNSSEAIQTIIKESYKQSRHDDDLNQPLSVQPWGRDGDKRRYWLIEGRDDTSFRLYRESNPALKHNTWWSVAGSLDELRAVAQKLLDDGAQASRRLSERISNSIPRFEATEEKRKRREYRLARKAQFSRPEPGFSLYEGRTRGKRMKYTFSDDEDETSDAYGARRSSRNSGFATPSDPSQPTVTASGRHVRQRLGGVYGETLLSGQTTQRESPATGDYERSDMSEEPHQPSGRAARTTRAAQRATTNGWSKKGKHIEGYNSLDEMDDEDEASSSGNEWDGGDEDSVDGKLADDEDDEASDASSDDDLEPKSHRSLIVHLKYRKSEGKWAISKTETEEQRKSDQPAEPKPQPTLLQRPHFVLGSPVAPGPVVNGNVPEISSRPDVAEQVGPLQRITSPTAIRTKPPPQIGQTPDLTQPIAPPVALQNAAPASVPLHPAQSNNEITSRPQPAQPAISKPSGTLDFWMQRSAPTPANGEQAPPQPQQFFPQQPQPAAPTTQAM